MDRIEFVKEAPGAVSGHGAIAIIAHTVNQAWCLHLGDTSQKDWDDAPEWQRESAIAGVVFHLANPDASASASHENWMKDKIAEGWLYGEKKDAKKKTHPCIVPFDQLPPDQQVKDKLFKAIVTGAAHLQGLVSIELDRDLILTALDEARAAPADATLEPAYFSQARELLDELGLANPDASAGTSMEQVFVLLRDLHGKAATLSAELEKAGKALNKAKGEIQVFRKGQGPKLRKVGPMKDGFSAEDFAALIGSEPIELVLSDGKSEIRGLDPIVVEGATAWVKHLDSKWLLKQRLELHATGGGDKPLRIPGVGLFVDGDQVAWAEFFEPLVLTPGERHELVDSIIV